jgi:hypothetical protein
MGRGRAKKRMTVQEMARQGGRRRALVLTPEERRAIAKRAAVARWAKAKQKRTRTTD